MALHTPGPWKAGTRSVTAPETEDRLGLDVRLYGGNAGDNRANARLISAAPCLLDALRSMLEDDDHDEAKRKARAAIAKATGAQP